MSFGRYDLFNQYDSSGYGFMWEIARVKQGSALQLPLVSQVIPVIAVSQVIPVIPLSQVIPVIPESQVISLIPVSQVIPVSK